MPYERYGFTLLMPGWDGTRRGQRADRRRAPDTPSGTLWALEQSLRDGGKRQTPSAAADVSIHDPVKKAGDETQHSDRRS